MFDHEPLLTSARYPLLTAPGLVTLGLPGLASLLFALPEIPGAPRLALLINPAILLIVLAFAGTWAAPRAGLRSTIGLRLSGTSERLVPRFAVPATLAGASLGFATALGDHATRALWQGAALLPPSLVEGWQPERLVTGLLYGGVVEEIMMRWGLMSLLLLGLWRFFARRDSAPPESAIRLAIASSAMLFAAGHLPALLAQGIPLELPIVLRTLAWNAVAGCLFGWIFARHDLESAMFAHAGFHIGILPAVALHAFAG